MQTTLAPKTFVILIVSILFMACVPEGRYNRLKSSLADVQGSLEQREARVAQLESELKEARERIAALEQSIADLQAQRDAAITDLEKRLNDAKRTGSAQSAQLQKELSEAKTRREQQVAALQVELDKARAEAAAREAELARLNSTYTELVDSLQDEIQEGRVTISQLEGRLTVNLIDKILFDSGSAELNAQGQDVLRKVGEVLEGVENRRISVEGHTDDVPIIGALQQKFPTNWELSTARATTVVRFLIESGVPPERLSAVGYAMHSPVAPNDSDENRRLNRRIEIVLLPELRVVPQGNEEPASEGAASEAN